MAPSHLFLVLFLTFVFYFSSLACAAPWIVTRYYEPGVYSDDGYTNTYMTITPTVTIDIIKVTPTASSMPAALSTTTVTTTLTTLSLWCRYYCCPVPWLPQITVSTTTMTS